MSDHLYHAKNIETDDLEEKLRSLETKISALLDSRKTWESREYHLKKLLWMRTGELAVLSDFFNNQAHEQKERH